MCIKLHTYTNNILLLFKFLIYVKASTISVLTSDYLLIWFIKNLLTLFVVN